MKWIKEGRTVNSEGTTITYRGEGTDITIESRKRHIPHSNNVGTWDHTSYFVLKTGQELKECYTLRDAKEFAEGHIGKNAWIICNMESCFHLKDGHCSLDEIHFDVKTRSCLSAEYAEGEEKQ